MKCSKHSHKITIDKHRSIKLQGPQINFLGIHFPHYQIPDARWQIVILSTCNCRSIQSRAPKTENTMTQPAKPQRPARNCGLSARGACPSDNLDIGTGSESESESESVSGRNWGIRRGSLSVTRAALSSRCSWKSVAGSLWPGHESLEEPLPSTGRCRCCNPNPNAAPALI